MKHPILVYGATGGIGEALVRRLATTEVPVFLTGRSDGRLSEIASEVNAPYRVCDVMDSEAIAQVTATAAQSGGLSGLAYCVGSINLKPLKSTSESDFLDAFKLNVIGAAMALKSARESLIAGKGSAVLFSTVAVAQGFANHAVVSAAKGGVEGLTRAAAAEFAPHARVNAVAPSLTRTPLAEQITRSEAMADAIAKQHALPRLGEADDIAAAAMFLLSQESAWITGQVIPVDGGRSSVRTTG